ncbi:MAG: trimethylamine methyltransferase family protein, partial [Acidimicrobiales bacterium]
MTATRRRGDRSRRSRDRGVKVIQKLERRIPYYDLFEEDGLDLIELHADRILAEVGIEIWGDEVTIELFRDAGATVDGQRLRFDPGLVTDIVKRTTPGQFVQHSRDPERSVTIGGDHTVFAPGYGMPFVRDLDRGRRYGTMADLEDLVKINHTLEWTHHSGLVICEPTDVAVNKRHLDMLALHFRHSTKP